MHKKRRAESELKSIGQFSSLDRPKNFSPNPHQGSEAYIKVFVRIVESVRVLKRKRILLI